MSHFFLGRLLKLQNNEIDLLDFTQEMKDRWVGDTKKAKDDIAKTISELNATYLHSEQACLLYLSDPSIIDKYFMNAIKKNIDIKNISSPLTLVFHLHTRRNLCMNCAISLRRELERNNGIFSKIAKKVDDYIQENAALLLGAAIGNLEGKLGKPQDDEKEKVTINIKQFRLISEIWKMISEIKEEQWKLVGLERETLKCMTNAILRLQEKDLEPFVSDIKKFHAFLTKKTQRVLLVSFREELKDDKRGTGDFKNLQEYKKMLPVDLTTLPLNLKNPIFAQMKINS
ncbi:MAG: hypothetical protein HYS39_02330 [Proteobacteria bacterium]|nr:hypothetical protein [Pseudomonadota bacterium]